MSWCNAVLLACNTAAAVHLKTKQINMLVLPKIKTAANVDTVCFEKTGTLTGSEVRACFCRKGKCFCHVSGLLP
jgi:magnesium-transporting ATPase (P-type)